MIETCLGAVRIPADDSRIQLLGRFDTSTAGQAAFCWSGSTIRFQLKSRQARITLGGAGVRYGLRLNGADSAIWQGKMESTSYGIGGQWHPNLRTHAIMAAKLSAAIAEKTGWPAVPIEIPPVTQATR